MVNLTRRITILSVMALAMGMGSLFAQTDRGTITGTVTDSSGARVAGAAVNITAVSTGITTKVISNADGNYSLPNLQIGKYNVSVEHPGFKKYTQEGIVLNTGQTVGVDISLQVGNVTETVQVTSEGPQLQAETTSLSTVATATLVQDLPLVSVGGASRNPGLFMIINSSVSSRGAFGPGSGGGAFNNRSLSTTVAGSPSASSEFQVDGAPLTTGEQVKTDFTLLGFPQDAVEEFNTTTVAMPAEMGYTGGGMTSFTLKAGGNQLHASGWEYLRNNVLDAKGHFPVKSSPLRQNEFGGEAGGKILRDKLFFFGWYDGLRYVAGSSSQLQTVPTAQMLQGNFSNFTSPGVGVVPIYDPATTTGGGTRTQFPGNVIPSGRFDKVAAAIAPYFPAPSGPNASADVNNFLEQGVNAQHQNEFGGKVTWQASTKNRLDGSYTYQNEFINSSYNPFPPPLSETAPSIVKTPMIIRLGDDYLISPNLENHATVGFNRIESGNTTVDPVAGGWPAKLGYGGLPFTDGAFPIFNIASGIPQFGGGGGNPGISAFNTFTVNESLSWVKGKHTAKFGMEFIREGQNSFSSGRASGYLFVNAQETGLPTSGSAYGVDNGIGFASFLLGQVDSGMTNIYFAPVDGGRGGYWAAFVQDDWKVSSKLTANLGMRWDVYEPSVEVHNHAGWMNPGLPNPDAGGILGAAQFAVPGLRSDAYTVKDAISPRIGLAYAVNNKTVIRANFSILMAPGGYLGSSVSNFNQGFNTVQTLVNSSNGVQPAYVLQNGWPVNQFPAATVNLTPGFALGSGIQRLDPQDARPPYMLQRAFQIQRQLPGNMLLSVGYVGNHGTRLQSRIDVDDEMPPQYLSLTVPYSPADVSCPSTPVTNPSDTILHLPCAAFPQAISNPLVQAIPTVANMPIDPATGNHSPFNGFEKLLGGGATLGQALRTFPQYVSMRRLYEGDGKSDYNSLQANLNKRFSDGLTMLVSYTWSKTLTNAASQFDEFSGFDENSFNQKPQKGLSLNDYPQNVVATFSYELPFGPGKKLLPQGGPAGKIVGGWKIAGILNYQSGPPQLVYEGNALAPYEGNNDNGDGFALPNILPGVSIGNPARHQGHFDPFSQPLLNPAAFALTPSPTANPGLGSQSYFGDAPVTIGGNGRRMPYYDEDISIIKKTQITERLNVEFRADFLNLFNRTVAGLGTGGDMYGSILANGVGSTSFGVMSSQSNTPRQIQFGLKVNY